MAPANQFPGEESSEQLERIASFIDGTLSREERDRLLAVLADDEDAYQMFVGAIEYLRAEAERTAASRRKWRTAAILAVVATALALLWVLTFAL